MYKHNRVLLQLLHKLYKANNNVIYYTINRSTIYLLNTINGIFNNIKYEIVFGVFNT